MLLRAIEETGRESELARLRSVATRALELLAGRPADKPLNIIEYSEQVPVGSRRRVSRLIFTIGLTTVTIEEESTS